MRLYRASRHYLFIGVPRYRLRVNFRIAEIFCTIPVGPKHDTSGLSYSFGCHAIASGLASESRRSFVQCQLGQTWFKWFRLRSTSINYHTLQYVSISFKFRQKWHPLVHPCSFSRKYFSFVALLASLSYLLWIVQEYSKSKEKTSFLFCVRINLTSAWVERDSVASQWSPFHPFQLGIESHVLFKSEVQIPNQQQKHK